MNKQIRQSAQLDSEQEPQWTYSIPFVIPQSLLYNHYDLMSVYGDMLKELYHNFIVVRTTEYGESEQQILEELTRIQLDMITEVKEAYVNKNGLNKHISEENRKDKAHYDFPIIGDVRIGDFDMEIEDLVINDSGRISIHGNGSITNAADFKDLEIFKTFNSQKTFNIKDDGISYAKCNHKWKKYIGLSESFTYCEVCDAKKGES